MWQRQRRRLPIPLMPAVAWIAATRGLRICPIPPTGTERSIYLSLRADADVRSIFDVGANVGDKALRFSSSFPDAEICCFEPITSTYRLLRQNSAKNGRIRCFPYAVSDGEGKGLAISEANSQMSWLVGPSDNCMGSPVQEVTLTTIDKFCAANGINRIDIIKTDTEGHDLAVLRGAAGMLKKSVTFVMSEVGMKEIDTRHSYFHAVNEYLMRFKFIFCGFYDLNYEADGTVSYADALFVRAKAEQ